MVYLTNSILNRNTFQCNCIVKLYVSLQNAQIHNSLKDIWHTWINQSMIWGFISSILIIFKENSKKRISYVCEQNLKNTDKELI